MNDLFMPDSGIDVVSNGQIRPSWAIQAVDALLEKVRTKDMWEVIDFLVETWCHRHPEYAHKVASTQDLKNKYAATEDLGSRHLVSVPADLADIIRYFYADEMTFEGKTFWINFGKRYPIFAVAEKF
jgi:hypothetical protein